MVLLVILLVLIAFFACAMGNMNILVFASRKIYHRSLFVYPKNNRGITLFLKDSTWKELALLALAEFLRAALPVLVGGWLMISYKIPQLGRAFAMFCYLLGNDFPIMYRFKGQPSLSAFAVAAICVYPQLGLAAVGVFFIMYFITRYISLSAMVAALAAYVMSIIAMDNSMIHWLFLASFVLVVIEYRRSILNLIRGKEPKFRYRKDISYMFDEQ